jgi:hypothetical protein
VVRDAQLRHVCLLPRVSTPDAAVRRESILRSVRKKVPSQADTPPPVHPPGPRGTGESRRMK